MNYNFRFDLIASRIPPSLPIGLWVVGLSYLFFLFLLLGHWIVWLKGCGVVVVTHTPNQKTTFQPTQTSNTTEPNQATNQSTNQPNQSSQPENWSNQPDQTAKNPNPQTKTTNQPQPRKNLQTNYISS